MVIALDTVQQQSLGLQVIVVSLIALLAVAAVYGVVALLVRMDDTGLYLVEQARGRAGRWGKLMQVIGVMLINALPKVIRVLGIIGTLAMLLVGGGMYVHNIDTLHHWLAWLPPFTGELLTGLVLGAILVVVMHGIHGIKGKH